MEELEKERKDLQLRLRSQEKKVDYFERAKRLVEIPLLKKMLEEEKVRVGSIYKSVYLMYIKHCSGLCIARFLYIYICSWILIFI